VSDSGAGDEARYATHARSAMATRVLKHGDTFGVFAPDGDIWATGRRGAEGLYHRGTRFLSSLRLELEGQRLLLLSSAVGEDNLLLTADLTNPDIALDGQHVLAGGAIHVLRTRFLWDGACHERMHVTNHGAVAVNVRLGIAVGSDFADVFEVRGSARARRGELAAPRHDGAEVVLGYTALDGGRMRTRLRFEPAPSRSAEGVAEIQLRLEPKETREVQVCARCEADAGEPLTDLSYEGARAAASSVCTRQRTEECVIETSSEAFDAWITRSLSDLRMLVSDTPHGPYPYAGVPWYSTPFGRDGIITALEALWVNPNLARGVLCFLAANQAEASDHDADSEPGKILHELRFGEMARLREIPFGRYYGSVDATPLFVVLAAAYFEATADRELIERLWPHVEAALRWMDEHGDADGDGFIEYARKSADGLVQQGWKDSHDSVFHADGTLAEGPIAVCEVQGYAYAARRGAAQLSRALGHRARAQQLDDQADALRASFDRAFWCDDLGTYALALDGKKRPCRVQSSNPGHCLLMGIVLPERAPRLIASLLAPEMFSGWGIRTLASSERRYNPMSYHNGSVWPHDNALIAAGMARQGFTREAMRVLEAMFDACRYVELHRLPELFCGFPRRPGEGPTLYPVACSPQAWVAAAPLLMLQASLGMSIDASRPVVRFEHAALPAFLREVRVSGLRVGAASIDLSMHRYGDSVGVDVVQRRGAHTSAVTYQAWRQCCGGFALLRARPVTERSSARRVDRARACMLQRLR
jgi:glycogen debranching enzyme